MHKNADRFVFVEKIIKENNIVQVLLAIPSATNARRREIINLIEPLSIQIKTLSLTKGTKFSV